MAQKNGRTSVQQILDVAFKEDDRPWILHNRRLTAAIMVLRRIGCSLLAIFGNVTQRSDHCRHEPWHVLLTRVRHVLLLATAAALISAQTHVSATAVLTPRVS